jgi:hypothetical protein
MQRTGVTAIVAVLALGLASCGGSGGATDAATQFRAQATAVCRQMGAQVQAIARRVTRTNERRSLIRVSTVIGEGVQQLDELTPPTELTSQYKQLRFWLSARGRAARELAQPHPHLTTPSRRVMEGTKSPLRKAASAIGLRGCS